jgi:hypothetical protein
MAGGKEKTTAQDIIRLASPIFYEIDIFDFRDNTLSQRSIDNKFVYLISYFDSNGKIGGRVYFGFTGNDGILYDETKRHRIMILPGDYYIFVAENPLDDFLNKITKDICNGPFKIDSDTKEVLFPGKGVKLCSEEVYVERLFYSTHVIGNFSNETKILVRRYGFGKGNDKAIFLIGRIHGNESGAENSIRVMEDYLIENPSIVLANTSVFILTPASKTSDRLIRNIDPNRNFMDNDINRLNETQAIAHFTRTIAQQWKNFTIISAHQYNDIDGLRPTRGVGYVFPLYDLTEKGLRAISGKRGGDIVYMEKGSNPDYTNPKSSEILAKKFAELVQFTYEPMWYYAKNPDKAEMYPGEYIYFISRINIQLHKSVRIIEYEIPRSDEEIETENTKNGLIGFIVVLLGE